MNQNRNESKQKHPEPIWSKVKRQWKIGLGIFAAPLIIIPLIACCLSLYFATYRITEHRFSLVLNIIAAILAGVASGGIWDTLKNMMENTILIKKGDSAVRNLSLARLKVKNIFERTKMKASSEEIMNLLSLLEKDVANSLQEWNDILPGVANIEVVYSLLAEKENELNTVNQNKDDLYNRLTKGEGEKEELQKEFDKMKKRVLELNLEIERLKTQAVSTSGYFRVQGRNYAYMTPAGGSPIEFLASSKFGTCSKCGKPYEVVNALADKGLCNDCSK